MFVCAVTIAEDRKSLSTSNFMEVPYLSKNHEIIKTCSGKKARYGQNYVSIGVNKLTVNKNDPFLVTIFNKDRYAFGVANLKADYQSLPISVSRVGKPVRIMGEDSSIDMGVEWVMLDRIPWVLKNASFQIKLGYSADSSTDSMIEAFSGITSAIPDYTISTSLATGFAVASTIDKLLFGSDRATDLLNAQKDIPLLGDSLCEGYYALFSAENKNTYKKYSEDGLVWTGKDLEYNDKPINDVSYAVISVRVSDRYYDSVRSSVNDHTRSWASKYKSVQTSFFDFIWVTKKEKLDNLTEKVRTDLLEARTLLNSDPNLIQQEIEEIHQYVIDRYIEHLEIAKLRINKSGNVTLTSTEQALNKAINSSTVSLSKENSVLAERLLLNENKKLLEVEPGFDKAFRGAIMGTQQILSIE